MRIIDTIVPISIDNLKEYFSDKEVIEKFLQERKSKN